MEHRHIALQRLIIANVDWGEPEPHTTTISLYSYSVEKIMSATVHLHVQESAFFFFIHTLAGALIQFL